MKVNSFKKLIRDIIREELDYKFNALENQGLPDHLANALNKDYSEVMQKVEEKARFKNGV